MQAALNERLTRIGPGTPCGELMRRYWQPVALLDEFDPALDPRMAVRPLKAVRLLGQDLVLFRDEAGRWGLLDRDCPHRGADLAYARHEGDGLRCPFHGWKFDASGRCLETPAEPPVNGQPSTLCQRVRQRSYPLRQVAGVLFAYLGPEDQPLPALPAFDAFTAPASHRFAFKGLWHANWLQAFEVGIDPAHPSFLHRYLEDEDADPARAYGRQFRAASAGEVAGERWPMTRVMREFCSPEIQHAEVAPGLTRLTALRRLNDELTHVRVTHAAFPHTFVIPLSETLTITQLHVPVDDTHTYWYSFFTSFAGPLDQATMRAQRLAHISLPDYVPKNGRHNQWNFNPEEQRSRTYLGMGEEDINLHDQWAVESMGPIQDRTREHLGTSDKVIMANRRTLMKAIDTVEAGGTPPMVLAAEQAAGLQGPDTIDCIAPTEGWAAHWQAAAAAKRAGAAWLADATAAAAEQQPA
ncbi:Rieske 2Fe-2S domain-containing protein [Rubrivivax rivuli]|uniref:Aromatic ring-hydroxylating dioxygenase subunit alpha n=1 Tax=Rubrivivax rivuli TaxID=1862385 RepID=A0A437RCK8_9BURK|nr:Rieske 2Fe-2S domain-containing protein [Rubrivivax rivuli]RVU44502.1 aromatic ring-hydroxylating dioxygenase subunit alpha [Rubrivivax rivuli]